MSVLGEVFTFIETMETNKECRLPVAVTDELLCCAALLCLAEFDVCRPVCTTIAATDATPTRAGRCQANIPDKLARALYRHSEPRGEHGRLDWS